jgi:hypothetical protein
MQRRRCDLLTAKAGLRERTEKDMKNKRIFIFAIAAALSALIFAACGKYELAVTENTEKHMLITAENADKDAAVMVGILEVAEGEQISIAADLSKGSVRVEIIEVPEEQSSSELPDLDADPIMTANLTNKDGEEGTVPAGEYELRATCLEKATGTIQIDVLPVK